jgi:hypothetical protein
MKMAAKYEYEMAYWRNGVAWRNGVMLALMANES